MTTNNKKNWLNLLILVCAAFLGATACLGGGETLNPDNGKRVCDDGQMRGCPCSDGRNGSQACNANRDGWDTCSCTGPVPGTGGSPSTGGSTGCGSDADCASGRICENGKCVTPPPPANTGGSPSTGGCITGSTQTCTASNGAQGVQTCGTDHAWGPCNAVSGTGGSTSTGGTSSTGNTGGLVNVDIVYTLPSSENPNDVTTVRVYGWVPDFSGDSDLCNSENKNPGTKVFVRSGSTYTCTVSLPANWRDGQFNVEVHDVNGRIKFPSRTEYQSFCGELMGNDVPSGCGSPCYMTWGSLRMSSSDLNGNACRKSNGQSSGCNVFPSAC